MSRHAPQDETTSEDLMQQLECTVCLDYCVPPIYMCQNGHQVCSKCRESLDQCGICRTPGVPSIRNLAVEGISSLLVKSECQNSPSGCTAMLSLKDLQEHLPKCEFSYECRFDCRWKGSVADLEMHAVNAHPNSLWECLCSTVVPLHLVHTHYCYCMTLLSAGGGLFWYTHEFDVVTKMFSVSVCQAKLAGEQGIGYWFRVEFQSKSKRNKCMIESTVVGDETKTSKSHISLANIVDSFNSDKVIPFKFSIYFK